MLRETLSQNLNGKDPSTTAETGLPGSRTKHFSAGAQPDYSTDYSSMSTKGKKAADVYTRPGDASKLDTESLG